MPAEVRKLRADATVVHDFLEQLDEAAASAQSNPDAANVRDDDRYRYRVDSLVVELSDAAGSWTRYEVPSRNISRNGVGVVLGHFVYPNTECRVHLVSLHNHTQSVRGKVVRCRYVPGSARMHEVGIQFTTPVDVGLFFRGASYTRVLIAADDPDIHHTAERILKSMNFDVVIAKNGLAAVELASDQSFDIVLLDLDMPVMDGIEALRELRNRGFPRAVVALTPDNDDATKQRCLEAGFTLWTAKPFNRESLGGIIDGLRIEPIVSDLLHDPKMAGQIDSFVRDLPERMREMECAFIEKDFDTISRIARALAAGGAAHGFEAITRSAGALCDACGAKAAPVVVREKLNDLMRVMLAARPVSCLEWHSWPTKTKNR